VISATGIDGDDAQPRTAMVTVRNTGTGDWTAQLLQQFDLRSGPVPESSPLPGPVPAGSSVTIPVDFVCLKAGRNTFTVQMTFSGVPIGPAKEASTRCLGTDTKPGGNGR
jgi:hypothetical protein